MSAQAPTKRPDSWPLRDSTTGSMSACRFLVGNSDSCPWKAWTYPTQQGLNRLGIFPLPNLSSSQDRN
jgi:hypothetical protein